MAFDEKLADRINEVLKGNKGLVSKQMFGGIAFMLNGRMCTGVIKDDLMVRVDPDQYEALLKKPGARPMDFAHRPMKGFIYVDPKGCSTEAKLRSWVEMSAEFALSQPPKAAGGKKKSKPVPRSKLMAKSKSAG